MKQIFDQRKWSIVSKELEAENLKLASYDSTMIPLIGRVADKKILDYGCGPGVLALTLQKLGADVNGFDISSDMLRRAGEKIGAKKVYSNFADLPKNYFDFVICNLVLCIVSEAEVKRIMRNIKSVLKNDKIAYIGFCNPEIFNIRESRLDLRFPTGNKYEENHAYKKIKKEGKYEITELHRPIKWYENVYKKVGFKIVAKFFTPEYALNGNKISDFIIFKLKK
ncbi:MAG: class I SAM-dependent methyltransferase [Candidatus Micrarchaeota archaeon]|nr:class I SAM-dependent methyltransferase [Candidatus Micrarchaeota archaeon]